VAPWVPFLAILCGLTAPARASDLLTVNTTNAYVDPAVAGEFITVPNLCLEPYGEEATTTGCDELGLRAVQAYQGLSPYGDVYYEPSSSVLFDTRAFVPHNAGSVSYGEFSGFSPIFSQHEYDLFGRSGDRMGVFTREELLLLNIAFPADGTVPQTDPGEGSVGPVAVGYARTLILAVLGEPDGDTTVNFGGLDFDVAHLPTFERITGITDGGKADTIWAHCQAQFPAPPGLADTLCGPDAGTPGLLPFSTQADLWMVDTYVALPGGPDVLNAYFPDSCGAADGSFSLSNCLNHDQWIDQTVVGYVQAWEALGGDNHFAQNFRSQLNFDHSVALNIGTGRIVDQRFEQSVELSGAFTTAGGDPTDSVGAANTDFDAGRQTTQQAFLGIGGVAGAFGQMVSQDVQGYLMTCLNCDSPDAGVSHAFQPPDQGLALMSYQSGWDVVPTIVHAP